MDQDKTEPAGGASRLHEELGRCCYGGMKPKTNVERNRPAGGLPPEGPVDGSVGRRGVETNWR